MKRVIWVLLLILTADVSFGAGWSWRRWKKFSATAYAIDGETASGKLTREGHTVAADPKVLPLGTRIEVRGAGQYSGIYVVQDTGREIKGMEIDIYIDAYAEAKEFGRKEVRVRVLKAAKKDSKTQTTQKTQTISKR